MISEPIQTSAEPTRALDTFRVIYRHCTDMPDTARIISLSRRMICINLSAREGANVYALTE